MLIVGWVAVAISFARRQADARGDRLGAFADPRYWAPARLPLECRFVTHDTLLREVIDKLGPPSVRRPIPHGAIRYDWPDGRIMFLYAEYPESRGGRVSAIQIYDELADIPIDEVI